MALRAAFLPSAHGLRGVAASVVLLSSVVGSACGLGLGAEARETWKRSYTLADKGLVSLRSTNGRIVVTTGEGSAVEVVAEKIARAHSEDDARLLLKKMEIDEAVSAESIALTASSRGLPRMFTSSRVDYTVRMPRHAALRVVSTNGDIDITGVGGALEVRTTNGRIVGSSLGGSAVIDTTNGKVSLDFDAVGAEGVRCETTNGMIEITVPRSVKANFNARLTNGAVDVDDLDVAVTEKSRRRYEGSIGGGGPMIRVETTNGHIRLRGK